MGNDLIAVSDAGPLIHLTLIADLYDVSSLYVTRAIVEMAIQQLHEHIRGGT